MCSWLLVLPACVGSVPVCSARVHGLLEDPCRGCVPALSAQSHLSPHTASCSVMHVCLPPTPLHPRLLCTEFCQQQLAAVALHRLAGAPERHQASARLQPKRSRGPGPRSSRRQCQRQCDLCPAALRGQLHQPEGTAGPRQQVSTRAIRLQCSRRRRGRRRQRGARHCWRRHRACCWQQQECELCQHRQLTPQGQVSASWLQLTAVVVRVTRQPLDLVLNCILPPPSRKKSLCRLAPTAFLLSCAAAHLFSYLSVCVPVCLSVCGPAARSTSS